MRKLLQIMFALILVVGPALAGIPDGYQLQQTPECIQQVRNMCATAYDYPEAMFNCRQINWRFCPRELVPIPGYALHHKAYNYNDTLSDPPAQQE